MSGQGVPRRAVFDDLRVGQVIAWIGPEDIGGQRMGEITSLGHPFVIIDCESALGLTHDEIREGEVTILRDAPAPPVTVRREDYDALRKAEGDWSIGGHYETRILALVDAARALIDNADTGADA